MRVDFEYIKFRNFGSYGNNFTQYNFTTGLYNLFGAIGQGKSTVLSALYFCLYGKTFKVNISELINDINESNLETECKFSIGLDKYVIKRGLKPGYITVEKNNLDIDSLSRKKLIQEEIDYCENIISIVGEPILKRQLQKMLDSKRLKKMDF